MAAAARQAAVLLPEDMVLDILCRLPVKSLRRFGAVSRCWGALIGSPEFVSAHYSFSRNNKVRPLVHYRAVTNYTQGETMVSLISNNNNSNNSNGNGNGVVDVIANLNLPSNFGRKYPRLLGCCHGVVCLWDIMANDILLWNIATNESKILPIPPNIELELLPPGYSVRFPSVGFGYDSQTHDFKVVKMYRIWDSKFAINDPDAPRGTRLLLYTLSADSWTTLDCTTTLNNALVDFNLDLCCSNGFYHVWASASCNVDNLDDDCLLSFDFSKHVFITTPFPDGGFDNTNTGRSRFGTSFSEINNNGLVGAIYCHDLAATVTDTFHDVWVLGELGVNKSWTKLFTIGPIFGYMVCPLLAGINGEFFFRRFSTTEEEIGEFVVCYQHPSKKETTTLRVLGCQLSAALYAESLASFST